MTVACVLATTNRNIRERACDRGRKAYDNAKTQSCLKVNVNQLDLFDDTECREPGNFRAPIRSFCEVSAMRPYHLVGTVYGEVYHSITQCKLSAQSTNESAQLINQFNQSANRFNQPTQLSNLLNRTTHQPILLKRIEGEEKGARERWRGNTSNPMNQSTNSTNQSIL